MLQQLQDAEAAAPACLTALHPVIFPQLALCSDRCYCLCSAAGCQCLVLAP